MMSCPQRCEHTGEQKNEDGSLVTQLTHFSDHFLFWDAVDCKEELHGAVNSLWQLDVTVRLAQPVCPVRTAMHRVSERYAHVKATMHI